MLVARSLSKTTAPIVKIENHRQWNCKNVCEEVKPCRSVADVIRGCFYSAKIRQFLLSIGKKVMVSINNCRTGRKVSELAEGKGTL